MLLNSPTLPLSRRKTVGQEKSGGSEAALTVMDVSSFLVRKRKKGGAQ